MAKASFWQRGEALDYVNGTNATIEAGTILVIGTKIGVAGGDILPGELGALHVEGVFEVPKTSAAITLGAAVTFSGTAFAATASDDDVHGYAVEAADASAETIKVKINA